MLEPFPVIRGQIDSQCRNDFLVDRKDNRHIASPQGRASALARVAPTELLGHFRLNFRYAAMENRVLWRARTPLRVITRGWLGCHRFPASILNVVTPLLALAAGRERNGAVQIVPGAPRDPGSV